MSECYFPVARCRERHTMVRTDQPQRECAREHGCSSTHACPLSGRFGDSYEAYRQSGERMRPGDNY